MSKYYEEGKYIYECKSSPGDERIGDFINSRSLGQWINDLRILLKERQSSGFRYIFPVNKLDNKCIEMLEKLKEDFPDIDIKYFDCESVERLISQLEKTGRSPGLTEYITKNRVR